VIRYVRLITREHLVLGDDYGWFGSSLVPTGGQDLQSSRSGGGPRLGGTSSKKRPVSAPTRAGGSSLPVAFMATPEAVPGGFTGTTRCRRSSVVPPCPGTLADSRCLTSVWWPVWRKSSTVGT